MDQLCCIPSVFSLLQGRMSLMSPTPVESYRGLHSPCSDGYAVEDMEDPTVSNQLSMLISGGLPSPVRCKKFSGIVSLHQLYIRMVGS